jgi:UDP-N-acetylglucosamine 4,6-dehydratase
MRYLITGGTGSFGSRYAKRLIERGDEAVIFSRNELKQFEMRKSLPEAEYIIGDVRDYPATVAAAVGCDYIVHTAALKHVRTGEEQPVEVIKTNVDGTKNVVSAANVNRAKMVLLSTDKAVEPVNLYGASKMIAEKFTIDGGHRVVRYGNIWGSSGSILHIFKEQASKGHLFTITDPRMTRFIATFDQAMDLVDSALEADPSSYTIATLKAIRITDLAQAFDKDATFEVIGIQPGEKLCEKLRRDFSSDDAEKMTVEEIRGMINDFYM